MAPNGLVLFCASHHFSSVGWCQRSICTSCSVRYCSCYRFVPQCPLGSKLQRQNYNSYLSVHFICMSKFVALRLNYHIILGNGTSALCAYKKEFKQESIKNSFRIKGGTFVGKHPMSYGTKSSSQQVGRKMFPYSPHFYIPPFIQNKFFLCSVV